MRFYSPLFSRQSQNFGNPMGLLRTLTMVFWSFADILLICEFGERVSGRFDEIDKMICRLGWYSFPIEVQRMLPFVMMATHKPVIFRGFSNILLTRETFKQVKFCCPTLITITNNPMTAIHRAQL